MLARASNDLIYIYYNNCVLRWQVEALFNGYFEVCYPEGKLEEVLFNLALNVDYGMLKLLEEKDCKNKIRLYAKDLVHVDNMYDAAYNYFILHSYVFSISEKVLSMQQNFDKLPKNKEELFENFKKSEYKTYIIRPDPNYSSNCFTSFYMSDLDVAISYNRIYDTLIMKNKGYIVILPRPIFDWRGFLNKCWEQFNKFLTFK